MDPFAFYILKNALDVKEEKPVIIKTEKINQEFKFLKGRCSLERIHNSNLTNLFGLSKITGDKDIAEVTYVYKGLITNGIKDRLNFEDKKIRTNYIKCYKIKDYSLKQDLKEVKINIKFTHKFKY